MAQTQELVKRLDSALKKRRAGDYLAALNEFENLEAQSKHPQDIAALRFFEATCLTDLGRTDEALDRIAKVDKTKLIPSDQIDYEFEWARLEYAEGKIPEALERVELALRSLYSLDSHCVKGVSSNLKTLKGILLAEYGKCDDAIPILEEVPVQEEGWAEARILLGDCNYKKGLYSKAIDSYLGIISGVKKVDPIHRITAIRNIGLAYYNTGEYAKALEYLSQIEHDYDDSPDLKKEIDNIMASARLYLRRA